MTTSLPRRVERRAGVAASIATGLGALALAPLFTTTTWFSTVAALIVVVTLVGETARWARFPIALTPLLEFAAALAFLIHVYVPESAPLSFIPTPAALSALRDLLSEGGHVINAYTAPVPVSDAITALTALAIGTALVFIRALQRLGNPALAGAALMGMYLVPVFTLKSGAPWWTFAVALLGVIVLLVSHEQGELLHWGRVLNKRATWAEDSPRTPGLGTTGARLGVAALVAALIVPAITPTLSLPVLAFGGGNGPNSGGSGGRTTLATDPVTIAALASVRRDLTDADNRILLTYQSEDRGPTYLRMVALEKFDGTTWSPRQFTADNARTVTGGLPALTELTDANYPTRRYTIQIGPLSSRYLPLPYPADVVQINGTWNWDGATRSVFSETSDTTNLIYRTQSLAVAPTERDLRLVESVTKNGNGLPEDVLADVTVNDNVPAVVRTRALEVTAKAATPYDKALAIQEWFRNSFTYDLTARSQDDSRLIEDFLTERRGYCEQFASLMALMAREVGIPSRVAVGFAPGKQTLDGSWQVSTHDAHAWPELYFRGTGWIRFEPTPRAGDGSGIAPPSWAPIRVAVTPGSGTKNGKGSLDDLARLKKLEYERPGGGSLDTPGAPSAVPATSRSDMLRRVFLAILLIALVAAALFPSVVRWWRTRRRNLSTQPAEAAWDQLRDVVVDYGRTWSDAESPRRVAARLIATEGLRDDSARSLRRLSMLTEQSRYAPGGLTSADDSLGGSKSPVAVLARDVIPTGRGHDSVSVMGDAEAVRKAIASGSSWQVRLKARFLPRSVLSRRDE